MFSPASPQEIASGETLTFALTPDDGYEVGTISGSCPAGTLSEGAYETGQIVQNCSVHFNFDRQTHSVTPVVYRGQASFSPNGAQIVRMATLSPSQ